MVLTLSCMQYGPFYYLLIKFRDILTIMLEDP